MEANETHSGQPAQELPMLYHVVSRLAEHAAPYGAEPVRGPEPAAKIARAFVDGAAVEVVGAILLDTKSRGVAVAEVSRGTLDSSIVHPREVFGPALRLGTVRSVIVFHSHPSGDVSPSAEDVAVTRRMREAGNLLGIPVLDHVIVAPLGDAFFSFSSEGR